MAVFCAKCGEELLGAINRCWKCGTEYESRSGRADLPPLRRAPIVSSLFDGALEALVIDGTVEDPDSEDSGATNAQTSPMRRGSPFRPRELDPEDNSNAESALGTPPRATLYPRNTAAAMGASISIALGLLSLGLAYFIPVAGLITAGVGLGMGIWGLYSRRRPAAIFGLLLCCVAMTISGFFGAAEVYRAVHGAAPWESISYPTP